MPGILDAVHSIIGKITGLHGAGQWGFLYDKNGFQIAPAGMDGAGGSTASNSEGLSGAPVGVAGFPLITLNRQVGAFKNTGTGSNTLATYTLKAKTLTRTGQAVRIRAWGTWAGSSNRTLAIVIGGTTLTLLSATAINAATAAPSWMLDVTITKSGANTQNGIAQLEINGNVPGTIGGGVTNTQIGIVNTSMAETDTSDIVINLNVTDSGSDNQSILNDFKVDLEQF